MGMLLLSACNSTPNNQPANQSTNQPASQGTNQTTNQNTNQAANQNNAPGENQPENKSNVPKISKEDTSKSQTFKDYLIPELTPCYADQDWIKFSNSTAETIHTIYPDLAGDLHNLNDSDKGIVSKTNDDFISLLFALDYNIAPLDVYEAANNAKDDLKKVKLNDKYAKLDKVLDEIIAKAEPLKQEPKNIKDSLAFYSKHMRAELTLIGIDKKKFNCDPSFELLQLNKHVMQCASILEDDNVNANSLITNIKSCQESLNHVVSEGGGREFQLNMLKHDLDRLTELAKSLEDYSDSIKASATQQSPQSPQQPAPTTEKKKTVKSK